MIFHDKSVSASSRVNNAAICACTIDDTVPEGEISIDPPCPDFVA